MSTVANVTAFKPATGGALYRAPLNTTLPTDATTTLAAAFELMGYISDDGMSNDISISTDKEKAWGGDVVNVNQTERNDDFTAKLIESLNVNVLKSAFGDTNVTGTLSSGIAVTVNAKELEDHVYVCDMVGKNNVLKRIVIPIGRVSNVAAINYKDDESAGYELTITAQADSSGNTHYEYIKSSASSGT